MQSDEAGGDVTGAGAGAGAGVSSPPPPPPAPTGVGFLVGFGVTLHVRVSQQTQSHARMLPLHPPGA